MADVILTPAPEVVSIVEKEVASVVVVNEEDVVTLPQGETVTVVEVSEQGPTGPIGLPGPPGDVSAAVSLNPDTIGRNLITAPDGIPGLAIKSQSGAGLGAILAILGNLDPDYGTGVGSILDDAGGFAGINFTSYKYTAMGPGSFATADLVTEDNVQITPAQVYLAGTKATVNLGAKGYTALSIQLKDPNSHGIYIKAAPAQNDNPFEYVDSSGAILARIDAAGRIFAAGVTVDGTGNPSVEFAGGDTKLSRTSAGTLTVEGTGGAATRLTLKAEASQSGGSILQSWGSSAAMTADGYLTSTGVTSSRYSGPGGKLMRMDSNRIIFLDDADSAYAVLGADSISLNRPTTVSGMVTVGGYPAQITDLQEWKNYAGDVLTRVDSTGRIGSNGLNAYGSTVGGPPVIVAKNTAGGDSSFGVANYSGYAQDGTTETFRVSVSGGVYSGGFYSISDKAEGRDLGFQFIPNNRINISAPQIWMSAGAGLALRAPTDGKQGALSVLDGGIIKMDRPQQIRAQGENSGIVTLDVIAASAQTADIQQWRNSSGTALTSILPDGGLAFTGNTGAPYVKGVSYGAEGAILVPRLLVQNGGLFVGDVAESGYTSYLGTRAFGFYRPDSDNFEFRYWSPNTMSFNKHLLVLDGVQAVNYSSDPTHVPLVAAGGTGQTGDIQQWKNTDGTTLARVGGDGRFRIEYNSALYGNVGSNSGYFMAGDSSVNPRFSVSTNGVNVFGALNSDYIAVGQGVNYATDQSNPAGVITDQLGDYYLAWASNQGLYAKRSLTVFAKDTGSPSLVVKQLPAQSADLQQWQSSNGSVYSRVESDGSYTTGSGVIRAGGGALLGNANYEARLTVRGVYPGDPVISAQAYATGTGDLLRLHANTGADLIVNSSGDVKGDGSASFAQLLTNTLPDSSVGSRLASPASNVPSLVLRSGPSQPISNKQLTSNVATITVPSTGNFPIGNPVLIEGLGAPFDGRWTVASVPSSTTFTFAVTAGNVASTPVAANTAYAGLNIYSAAYDPVALRVENSSGMETMRIRGDGGLQWVVAGASDPVGWVPSPYATRGIFVTGALLNPSGILLNDGVNPQGSVFPSVVNLPNAAGLLSTMNLQSATGAIELFIKGGVGQTGDLSQWQDSAGSILARVRSDGGFVSNRHIGLQGQTMNVMQSGGVDYFEFKNSADGQMMYVGNDSITMSRPVGIGPRVTTNRALDLSAGTSQFLRYQNGADGTLGYVDKDLGQYYALQANVPGMAIRGSSTQTADTFQAQSFDGVTRYGVRVGTGGNATIHGNDNGLAFASNPAYGDLFIGSNHNISLGTNSGLTVLESFGGAPAQVVIKQAQNGAYPALHVQGATGQTGRLQQWLDSAGTPLSWVAADGIIYTPTPTAGNNSTRVATTAFVTTAVAAAGGGGTTSRTTAAYTTASLASGAQETGTVTLAKGYKVLRLTTDKPARVRLYTSVAKRDADASRAVGVDPTGNHGCLAEWVTTSGMLVIDCTPQVHGASLESTPGTSIPISVQNVDATAGTVTSTFIYQPTE